MESPLNGSSYLNLNRAGFTFIAEHQNKPCIVPLFIRIPVPVFSPVELYRELAENSSEGKGQRSHGFLLESMDGERNTTSYSFIGIDPVFRVTCGHDGVNISGDPQFLSNIRFSAGRDAIDTIKSLISVFNVIHSPVPRFSGGFVGYFSYDLIYSLLPGTARVRHKSAITDPVAEFVFSLDCMVLDHHKSVLWLVRNVVTGDSKNPDELYTENLAALMKRKEFVGKFLQQKTISGNERHDSRSITRETQPPRAGVPDTTDLAGSGEIAGRPGNSTVPPGFNNPDDKKDAFTRSVRQVGEYIRSGEVVQAVISREEVYPFREDPLALYQALREVNPSPYMYYLDFSDHFVVGASPEMLVRVEERNVTTVPIAGTRKRGCNEDEDRALEKELLLDNKERAEHVMLVDLARNDVGSVCTFGSVRVPQFMKTGKFSHVQHILSTVTGNLAKGYDSFDAFRACFPAGTVSGAPKIRAMEIIDELEPGPRGLYAGAVGYIGFDKGLEFAIAIRTAVLKDGEASVRTGAGIVADSDPDREWTETNEKIAAMKQAIKLAGGKI